jgi:hypothetical protein
MGQIEVKEGFSSTLYADKAYGYRDAEGWHISLVCIHDRAWMDKNGNVGCDCADIGQGLTEEDIDRLFDMREVLYG